MGQPDLLQIDLVVGMDQHVAHSCHGTPGNRGVPGACFAAQLLCGFAKNFQAANQSILEIDRLLEVLAIRDLAGQGLYASASASASSPVSSKATERAVALFMASLQRCKWYSRASETHCKAIPSLPGTEPTAVLG